MVMWLEIRDRNVTISPRIAVNKPYINEDHIFLNYIELPNKSIARLAVARAKNWFFFL